MIKSINQKHQSLVNRSVKWLQKYNLSNDQRDLASDNNEKDFDEDCAIWRKHNRDCEKFFDKYEECISALPSRERINIEKSEIWIG